MKMANARKPTDMVRHYAREAYVTPAKRRGESEIRIVVGDIQKAVGLTNRVPLVCQALQSRKFLEENHLILERREGPPSGLSTTVTFTYRVDEEDPKNASESSMSPLLELWGAGSEVFKSLGGGEAFIRGERRRFFGPGNRQ
jgi:hypothetical protein